MGSGLSIDEKILKGLEFLEGNSALFSNAEMQLLKAYILSGEFVNVIYLPDLVRQVLDELNLLDEKQDIYAGFLRLFSESFELIDKEIIEIGGGVLPRIGSRLVKYYEVKKVTVFDSRLSPYISDNYKLKLVRRKVRKGENDLGGDIIIGFMPCGGAEIILEQALKYNHDFMIALCEGGEHGGLYDKYKGEEEWLCDFIERSKYEVEKRNMGYLKIKSLKQYGDKYPVICNERI